MTPLKHLSTAAMVQMSEPWLDPARDRPKWLALQGGTALVENIEAAYHQLLSTQKQQSSAHQELNAIRSQQAHIDSNYDRMIQTGFPLLGAIAELADSEQEAKAILKARDELFPQGLPATQRSYAEEAGEVVLAQARLSPESITLLKKLKLPGGSFWTIVAERWFQWGKELGELEQKKSELEQQAKGKDELGVSRNEVLKARNRWIRVVRHLETAVELAELDESTVDALLGPLQRLAKKSNKRTEGDGGESAKSEPGQESEEPKAP